MEALKNFTEHRQRLSLSNDLNNRVGGGGTPDLKWRGWSKDFFGFEIIDSGILGDFFAYSKQSELVILHNVTEDALGCLEW